MTPFGYSVYDLLLRANRMGSERVAVRHSGGAVTYGELLIRVDSLAAGLHAQGIKRGTRICVLAQNSLEFFELYLASARIGAVVYPINWRLTADEVGHVVTRAEPEAFVHDAASAEVATVVRAAHPGVPSWFAIGGGADAVDFATLYVDDTPPAVAIAPDELFVVISTAAVDIIPRGAALSHGNVTTGSAQTVAAMGLASNDSHLLCLPLFHITALGFAIAALHAGGCNIISTRFDADEVVDHIENHDGSLMGTFAPMLGAVLDAAAAKGAVLANLRHVSGLEAPDTITRYEAASGGTFYAGFGQSETSGFVTIQRFSDRPGASGRIGMMADVAIVDEADALVANDVVGEIVVRGPLVMREYFGQPDVTAEVFRNGWHHTGDLGRLDADGYLFYAGRKPEKELIKSGGENVYPSEVEGVIEELDAVRGVCVHGVPDEKWGEAVKAVVECDDGALTAEDIIEHVGSRIGRFKRPRIVEFTQALPRDEQGRVDRAAVKGD